MTTFEPVQLSSGSRWDGVIVIDKTGSLISAHGDGESAYLAYTEFGEDEPVCRLSITDALAVIRAAGLDQELNEAMAENESLKSEVHYAKQIVKAVREGSRELEDRLEAANKRIAELESENAELKLRDDYVESCLI